METIKTEWAVETKWAKISAEALEVLEKNHKKFGEYQFDFLMGEHALSGSDLKGKAKNYGGRYAHSRGSALKKARDLGIKISEVVGKNNRRILVLR